MDSPHAFGWFFPVAEAPVEAVAFRGGSRMTIPVPGRKALVDEQTGRILGVVGRDHRVITNPRAVDLARPAPGADRR